MKDSKVKLYTGKPVLNKRGNIHHREEKVETDFRLMVIKNEKQSKEFWFLTNEFATQGQGNCRLLPKTLGYWSVSSDSWKQELNLSHLVSTNKNGIEVMIYMTMIASMLLLIYKKVNSLGYKTAKRAHCHGTLRYDYRNSYRFCRRRPRKGIQNLVIKNGRNFFRPWLLCKYDFIFLRIAHLYLFS